MNWQNLSNESEGLLEIIDQIMDYFVKENIPIDPVSQNLYKNNWHFVHFNLSKIKDQLKTISQHPEFPESVRFLEVGAGIPIVSRLARLRFPHAKIKGIEFNPELIKKGVSIFPNIDVELWDAMKYNHYNNYNIIYFYRLFKETADQEKFELYLHKQINPGTYIIANYHTYQVFDRTDFGYQQIAENLFYKPPKR